jgi:hypothetical protein
MMARPAPSDDHENHRVDDASEARAQRQKRSFWTDMLDAPLSLPVFLKTGEFLPTVEIKPLVR